MIRKEQIWIGPVTMAASLVAMMVPLGVLTRWTWFAPQTLSLAAMGLVAFIVILVALTVLDDR